MKTRGIFLGHVKYSDSSIIVHLFTEDFGKQSYIFSGSHGKRALTKFNVFQPMFLLELQVYHRQNTSSLPRIKEARLAVPLLSMPFNIYKSTQSIFMAELLSKVLHVEEASNELFQFIFSSVELLDALEDSTSNFLLLFVFKLMRFLGIAPHEKTDDRDCFFDLLHAMFVDKEPIHPHFLSKDDTERFTSLFQAEYFQMKHLGITSAQRRVLLDALVMYYRIHLEIEHDFKSLVVLREVMQ